MKILNVDDNAIKSSRICNEVKRADSNAEIDWVRNLEEAVKKIEENFENNTPYDLVITDMWYPKDFYGGDVESGDKLIAMNKTEGWNLPMILVSTINYHYRDILGCLHYSENEDWESRLRDMIKELC
ncbi:MAG: hypothetical protein K5776_04585 [Lachnospiraceae bacterium]|nr:hypothetical protein [Lachnospiraceae bacterium]